MGGRIGVFGGTFDPPHLGHLILAEEIREDFDLREIYFMPCNEPPHKQRSDLTRAKHRFAMVVAATIHNPAFVASPMEVSRPGKSYSIDTMRMLREKVGAETEILFVAGLDSFLEIETWKEYGSLLALCHFIVVSRPGHRFDELPERLPSQFSERVVDLRGGNVDPREVLAEPQRQSSEGEVAGDGPGGGPWHIFLSDAVHVQISSTEIRERVRRGRSIRYRVPSEVESYIRAHELYRRITAREAAS